MKETVFVCQSCGHQAAKWLGKCSECGEWNSLVEEKAQPARKTAGRNGFKLRDVSAVAFTETHLPIAEEVRPGVAAIGAYSGTGNVLGALYGRAAADWCVSGELVLPY